MIKRILGGLLVILGVIAGVAVAVMLVRESSSTGKETNPYEYDIEGFRNVPADLLKYAETGAIMPRLEGLHGVAVDAADRVYVVGRTALAIFDKTDAPAGGFNLAEPGLCLATDAQGSIYVGMTHHVEVFDFSGSKKASWESLGERAWIASIAVSSNQVFVADYGNRCVWRFRGRLRKSLRVALRRFGDAARSDRRKIGRERGDRVRPPQSVFRRGSGS